MFETPNNLAIITLKILSENTQSGGELSIPNNTVNTITKQKGIYGLNFFLSILKNKKMAIMKKAFTKYKSKFIDSIPKSSTVLLVTQEKTG